MIYSNKISKIKYIGYAFNKSDIQQYFNELQNMFKDVEILTWLIYIKINIWPIIENMCGKVLGKKIYKYEQCSYLENRPLKKSQLNYSAFDAIICVPLYKKL